MPALFGGDNRAKGSTKETFKSLTKSTKKKKSGENMVKSAVKDYKKKSQVQMKQSGVMSNDDMAKIAEYGRMYRNEKDAKNREQIHAMANNLRKKAGLVAGKDYNEKTGRFTASYESRAKSYKEKDAKKRGELGKGNISGAAYVDSKTRNASKGNNQNRTATYGMNMSDNYHTYDSDFGQKASPKKKK